MSAKVFQIFENYDTISVATEVNGDITVFCEGEGRTLDFGERVKSIDLSKAEALKLAFAILGRIGICEECGSCFRRKRARKTNARKPARFCSRKCVNEWARTRNLPIIDIH